MALFGVGATTLSLLFTGIHNAWDGVAYHVLITMRGAGAEPRGEDVMRRKKHGSPPANARRE